MVYDFHTHSFLSDGELSPIELIQRARVHGYVAIGLSDHAGIGELEPLARQLVADCVLATEFGDIVAVPAVELTHLPPKAIHRVARAAKEAGIRIVVVHGETIVEPVPPGTNRAALESEFVDVLAHPGLLQAEDARLAAERGVFLEISARRGHSLTNGRVVQLALAAGAPLLLNSDAHAPEDLLTADFAAAVLRGAGVPEDLVQQVLISNPRHLLARLGVVAPDAAPADAGALSS